MSHLHKTRTPALANPLVKDADGDPPDATFNHASVIGMLQHLQGHLQPDISCMVSSAAHFVHSPKRSHEEALKCIGQHLKGTINKGLILRPSGDLNIDVFVDSDFAGLWPHEDKQDPACIESRARLVICVSNCPVIWTSELQPEIALSAMEAEHNTLSFCVKSVLPFQRTTRAITGTTGIGTSTSADFKTTIWEDNTGAMTLANMEPGHITPHSKHCTIKCHWFCSHLKPNKIAITKIKMDEQRADILTKGLTAVKFEAIQLLLCGWQHPFASSRGSADTIEFTARSVHLFTSAVLASHACPFFLALTIMSFNHFDNSVIISFVAFDLPVKATTLDPIISSDILTQVESCRRVDCLG